MARISLLRLPMWKQFPQVGLIGWIVVASAVTAHAVVDPRRWGAAGSPISEAVGAEFMGPLAADGSGGFYFWGSESGVSPLDLALGNELPQTTLEEGAFLQRVDGRGRRPWSRDGRQTPEWHQWTRFNDAAVPDGSGGVIVFWTDGELSAPYPFRAQRYDEAGVPRWRAGGVPVVEPGCPDGVPCGSNKSFKAAVSDGSGGAFLIWSELQEGWPTFQFFVQRINNDGARQLGAFGIQVTFGSDAPRLAPQVHPDGAGGLIMLFEQGGPFSAPSHRMRRIDASGEQLWGQDAVEVGSDFFRRPQQRLAIDFASCRTPEGDILVTWVDERPTEDLYVDIYAQKITLDGVAAWPEGGVPVSMRLFGQLAPTVSCDDSGGGYVFFQDVVTDDTGAAIELGITGQRLSADGEALWGRDGIRVDTHANGYGYWPTAVSDGRGGAIVVWDGFWVPPYIYVPPLMGVHAQRLLPDGTKAWGDEGIEIRRREMTVSDAEFWVPTTRTISDGEGGAIVVFFLLEGVGSSRGNLYAQRLNDAVDPTPRLPFLLVHREGSGSGFVRGDPGAIDCGLRCGDELAAPLTTLVATAERGSIFAGWEGACSGTSACTLAADEDHFVVARFNRAPDRIGVYRPSQGAWYLDRDGSGRWDGCTKDSCAWPYGITGDLPVVGDWSGSGFSSIGVFRPSSGWWFLDFDASNAWGGCGIDGCTGPLGIKGDHPVPGDWSGAGVSALGVFRPSSGIWHLDSNANGDWEGCAVDSCRGPFGLKTDLPVAGDWIGDGSSRLGVFRPSNGYWFLDGEGANGLFDGCTHDRCLGPFGMKGDRPVVGDWTGSGKVSLGVFRPSSGYWYLDMNQNGRWDGCSVDGCLGPFGVPGDVPVVGRW